MFAAAVPVVSEGENTEVSCVESTLASHKQREQAKV